MTGIRKRSTDPKADQSKMTTHDKVRKILTGSPEPQGFHHEKKERLGRMNLRKKKK